MMCSNGCQLPASARLGRYHRVEVILAGALGNSEAERFSGRNVTIRNERCSSC